jgi:uncharacterized protein YyaL (SSP411 family)
LANHLAHETSAYLLQHAQNPVDWYAWSEEPWECARREDRPVLVSIGYSSCHWCHVMERECFENEEIARLMNERVIAIKVDREERPDVDQIYMDAVLRLQGSGGWPLNVFCTPDGRPFWGGTYFPPEARGNLPSWPQVIEAITDLYRQDRGRVDEQAAQLVELVGATPARAAAQPGVAALRELCTELMRRADALHGGFGAAPKFPTPTNLEALLLAESRGVAGVGTLDHVLLSCKRMARGGIFDQLGGGFHRYSTDARWLVPHFEKMLYDQGQLLRVYAEAFRQTGDTELRWPVEETLDWIEREMRAPAGGFFASQDADSEGEEGRFYVWNSGEVEAVLGPEEGAAFCDAYGVIPGGNFERTGKSVLEHGMAGTRERFAEPRAHLLAARAQRIAPDTDRKQISSWIAYTIGGIATASAAFGRAEWLERAIRAARFLEQQASPDGVLHRIHDADGARIPGFLDDYAAWLCALLDLHRAGAPDRYAQLALEVALRIRERFFDPGERRLFFSAGEDPALPLRPQTDSDGATPAALGLAALGLVRIGTLSGRNELIDVARAAFETHGELAQRTPPAVPTLIRAAALLESGPGVAVVVGPRDADETQALARHARLLLSSEEAVLIVEPGTAPGWLDPSWIEGRMSADEPTAYPCRGSVCGLPAHTPGELRFPRF